MISECREITALHPVVRHLAQALLEAAQAKGIPLKLGETYRSPQRQDYLYEQGRTRPGAIITYAKGENRSSYHQWGLAFDVYINDKQNPYDEKRLVEVGKLGKALGLEWGGDWLNIRDTPHFQYTEGISTESLKQGKNLQSILISLNGTLKPVRGFQVEGHNYIKIQDLRSPHIHIGYDEAQRVPLIEIKA